MAEQRTRQAVRDRLGRAFGGKTFKLTFGHRGGNQPVKDLGSGGIEITSHNHGFAVVADSLPSEVSFPYGLPQPGNYRIFVQVKRAGKIETGVFDVTSTRPLQTEPGRP